MVIELRGEMATASTDAVGSKGQVIWLTYVNRCEDRELKRAKGADKPEPKGKRPGSGATISPDADAAPPV